MNCDQFEPLIDELADSATALTAEMRAHLDGCARCRSRLEEARQIERFLSTREIPVPSMAFTAGVMAHINRERWQAERFVDLGFNLAVAAGLLFIVTGAAGLAWSFGFLTFTVDLDVVRDLTRASLNASLVSQVQTVATAAVILTLTLVLWWWAETDSSF